jgi:hypothetical protein
MHAICNVYTPIILRSTAYNKSYAMRTTHRSYYC